LWPALVEPAGAKRRSFRSRRPRRWDLFHGSLFSRAGRSAGHSTSKLAADFIRHGADRGQPGGLDVPATAVVGEPFRIKVGVKSSRACGLKGAEVEVLDDNGVRKGMGSLGDSPWPAQPHFIGPRSKSPVPIRTVPHAGRRDFPNCERPAARPGAGAVSFVAVRPPDHKLTIMIFDKETAAPIENAQVRVGCFRIATDASGLAELTVPDGRYEVTAWMTSHELPPTTIEVTEDMMLRLEATALPEEDPNAWLWM